MQTNRLLDSNNLNEHDSQLVRGKITFNEKCMDTDAAITLIKNKEPGVQRDQAFTVGVVQFRLKVKQPKTWRTTLLVML